MHPLHKMLDIFMTYHLDALELFLLHFFQNYITQINFHFKYLDTVSLSALKVHIVWLGIFLFMFANLKELKLIQKKILNDDNQNKNE